MTTQKEVKAFAKANQLYARWNAEWQEWAINRLPRRVEADYYTSDNQDALDQLQFLAKQ